jgi:hypothetical protein
MNWPAKASRCLWPRRGSNPQPHGLRVLIDRLSEARRSDLRTLPVELQAYDILRYHTEGVPMTDVLIRDIPDDVLAGVDARAARLGISRVEYIRRRLAADAATDTAAVSVNDLRRFADKFVDLGDESVMDAAWR